MTTLPIRRQKLAFALPVACLALWPGFFAESIAAQEGKQPRIDAVQRPPKAPLPTDLRAHIEADLGVQGEDYDHPPYAPVDFRLDRFDLNDDRKQEYFVVGLCSPTGNCELWAVQKVQRRFRTLLRKEMANVVCVRTTTTNGYLDLEIRSHGSAFDSGVTIFRFNGTEYELAEAYELRWEYDDTTGKLRQVEGPENSPKCHELFLQNVHRPPKPK